MTPEPTPAVADNGHAANGSGTGSPFHHLDDAIGEAANGADVGPAPRPELPRPGFGTVLRRLTGVDEEILAHVPSERPRYTKLGIVILGTAAVATFSMWLALGEIVGSATLAALPIAVTWGLFIANLDSWLVSSMHGTRWRNRIWMVLPRLLLAILFGVLIAEPLVLRIFEPAIERKVDDDRMAEVLEFQTGLKNCNPPSGAEPEAPVLRRFGGCTKHRVNPRLATPAALATQLNDLRSRRAVLQRQVATVNREQRRRDDIARRECNGTSGDGLTGRFGVGPSCARNRDEADRFRESNRVALKNRQLVSLNTQIARVERQRKVRADRYQARVAARIQSRVDEYEANQKEIGLLERIEALAALAGAHWHIATAAVLLRLVFIAIDCLPILVKVMGGTTTYDRLLDDRHETIERVFREQERTNQKRRTARLKLVQYRLEREQDAARALLDSEMRVRNAGRELELDADIDRLTDELLGKPPADVGPRV